MLHECRASLVCLYMKIHDFRADGDGICPWKINRAIFGGSQCRRASHAKRAAGRLAFWQSARDQMCAEI